MMIANETGWIDDPNGNHFSLQANKVAMSFRANFD